MNNSVQIQNAAWSDPEDHPLRLSVNQYKGAFIGSGFGNMARALAAALCVFLPGHSRAEDSAPGPGTNAVVRPRNREPIRPIPQSLPLDPAKVALGHKLFDEKMLSHDDTVSCASCHNLKTGGVDGQIGRAHV